MFGDVIFLLVFCVCPVTKALDIRDKRMCNVERSRPANCRWIDEGGLCLTRVRLLCRRKS